jgi:predicted HTH transcriptional regulator
MATVCAFANEFGGSVLIGVDDHREVAGVAFIDVRRITDPLVEMVGCWDEPPPELEFFELTVEDGSNVVLEVWVGAIAQNILRFRAPR